jgi:molecular chaperone GrpE (heat shock protein)
MPERKTVETAFGAVDEKALEALQNSFDTRRLLAAVEAVDQIRSRIDGLRDDLLDLHRMAAEVINEDYDSRPAREEAIWELAEMLASEMLEFADGLREAYHAVEELESLAPGEDWEDEDEAEE